MYTTQIDHMNLHQIANSGQCFRWQQINDNTYKIPAFGKELTISQRKAFDYGVNLVYQLIEMVTYLEDHEDFVVLTNDEEGTEYSLEELVNMAEEK